MLALIIACEVAFWVVLAAGLAARYGLGMRRLGLVLLALVPLIDLVLLVASTVDLRRGATADWAHGLAALYLGFSIAYGHSMVRWADGWAAYVARKGPRPQKLYGSDHAASARRDIGRILLAGAISVALLALAIWYVDDPDRTGALTSWFGSIGTIVVIVILVDLSDIAWPRKPKPS